ncbi:GNAT family N-acetyltransferase [Reinekea thalattae]|uniref:GNAT family N-acetyltransferase n=1 Tax=Reinekea thalattae TaxID=2593301 RepID=A0A5C8ZBK0_9GAMM|nr:GNAT family N-acetyltransferase [Reinekea thalattae]TXR54659.1 GNAT family N-acetyltransferase [Reinekea thalattae]
MNLTLVLAKNSTLVENLFQYYVYDMSQFMGWQPCEQGTYVVPTALQDVREYWQKPQHFPYLIYVNGQLAGFSLVRVSPYKNSQWDMGQFFVLRKYIGQGVGKKAFAQTVKKHPGDWLVRVLPNNLAAQKFWPKAIQPLAQGDVQQINELHTTGGGDQVAMEFFRFCAQ